MDKNILVKFCERVGKDPKKLVFASSPYLGTSHIRLTHLDALSRKNEWSESEEGVLFKAEDDTWRFDQRAAIIHDLTQLGVPPNQILDKQIDTFEMARENHLQGQPICSFDYWKSIYGSTLTPQDYYSLAAKGSPIANRGAPMIGIMLNG